MKRNPRMPHAFRLAGLALSLTAFTWCGPATAAVQRTEANVMVEITFRAAKPHAEPFRDLEMDAVFTDPAGTRRTVPAFWAGGDKWKVRYASPLTGIHRYLTQCTDAGDAGLHGVQGRVETKPCAGKNLFCLHGPVGVAKDLRHFAYADGTPFLWLGDTWWKGLSRRMTFADFQELTADRKAKGFSVVQIVCGPYPDEGAFEARWENEGGKPYETRDFTRVNPAYFDFADRRIEHLVEAGIVPAIVGAWGRSDCNAMQTAGLAGLKRHWRYLVARYGAFPVVWIVGGELEESTKWGQGPWGELAAYLRAADPWRHPLSCHTFHGRRGLPGDDTVISYDMIGGSHDGVAAVSSNILSVFTAARDTRPPMPVVCGETAYEGHMQQNFQDVQRNVFWMYLLSGAAGHTYGAAGVWHASVEGDPGITPVYDFTTWREGMNYPGSAQLGLGKKLLEQYPWWRFEPHPEWAEADCFAAGIPGETRFLYQPRRGLYNWKGMRVMHLERGVRYRAYYFNPVNAKRYQLGTVSSGPPPQPNSGKEPPRIPADEYQAPPLPSPQDWVLVLERAK